MSFYSSKNMSLFKSITKYLIVYCSLICTHAFAEVKAYVDRTEIKTNETFTLVVEVNELTNESPDLSSLPDKVLILGTSSYRRSSTIQQVSEVVIGWKIQLMIKEEGVYTIPEISLGGKSSKPIQITVKPDTSSLDPNTVKDIMLTSEVNKDSVYVQEQLILTVKLFRSVQTQYAKLSTPTVDNAMFEQLGEDTQYESVINGKRYFIVERKFAIFPQNSGTLTIPKVIFSADVLEQNSGSRFGRLLGRTRPVTLSTDAKNIEVKPYPTNHSGLWLPAKKLSLNANWNDVNQKTVGEPSTWSITLKGVGLHENQLPEIELPDVKGVKWYPDNAQKNRYLDSDGITGERVMRVAVVPTKEGSLTLPKINIRWFNTQSEKYEIAELPAQTINVLANPEQSTTVVMDTSPSASQGEVPQKVIYDPGYWRFLTYLLGALWLATLFALLTRPKIKSSRVKPNEIKSNSNSNTKRKLLQACNGNNAQQVYQNLLKWLNEIDDQSSRFHPMNHFIERLNDSSIVDALSELESSLFSQHQTSWSQGQQIKNSLTDIEKQLKAQQKTSNTQTIAPLYPG